MKLAGALVALLALAGCRNMVQQARYDEYETNTLYPDRMAMQHPPEGTVAQDAPQRLAAEQRPQLTKALIVRGRERFLCGRPQGRLLHDLARARQRERNEHHHGQADGQEWSTRSGSG